jgi:hypothetical protein
MTGQAFCVILTYFSGIPINGNPVGNKPLVCHKKSYLSLDSKKILKVQITLDRTDLSTVWPTGPIGEVKTGNE